MCCVEGRKFLVLFGYKLNQFGLRKCPRSHWLTNKAYMRISSTSQWQKFSCILPTKCRRKTAIIDMKQNYVAVTRCIGKANGCTFRLLYRCLPTAYSWWGNAMGRVRLFPLCRPTDLLLWFFACAWVMTVAGRALKVKVKLIGQG